MHTVRRIFVGIDVLQLVAVGIAAQCAANALKRPLSSAAGAEKITVVGSTLRTFGDGRNRCRSTAGRAAQRSIAGLGFVDFGELVRHVFAEIAEISAKNVQQKTGDNSHHVFIGFFA